MKKFLLFVLLAGGLFAQRPAVWGPESGVPEDPVTSPDGIASTQVAYGSGPDQIKGQSAFTYTEGTGVLKIGVSGSSANSISITGSSTGAVTIAAAGTNQNITLTPSGTGLLVINEGTSSAPTPVFAGIQLVGKDATQTAFQIETFAQQSRFITRRANGTAASPSALAANDSIAVFQATGYGTNAYSTARAGIGISAEEAWTNSANGMRVAYTVVLNGSTTGFEALRLDGAGRALFGVGGAKTIPAWGTFGAVSSFNANSAGSGLTTTDSSSSGTVATAVANSFAVPTFAASSATTFTNAANLYIAGDVAAGSNVTLTNSYGLWNVGKTRLDGAVLLGGTITKPGGTSPLVSTNTTITSGAGAATGTLLNAPSAGNPTCWIPINDNGVTRYIPAW